LEQGQQQVRDQRHPDLDFDGVGALPVEVAQREVLLYLPEQGLYLPAPAVNRDDCLGAHVEVVGQKRHELGLLPFFDVDVCHHAGDMVNRALAERHDLLAIRHFAFRRHLHEVQRQLIREAFLHLGDIDHATVGQLLEFPIVDVSPVKGHYLFMVVIRRGEHERVVES